MAQTKDAGTEITVTAIKVVAGIYVDLAAGATGNVQGTVQVILNAPEPYVTETVASSMLTVRKIDDTAPDVQAAIDTLTTAILVWEQEDNTPPAVPPPEPEM